MSKVIKSPVEKWPGSVTLFAPLTAPQVFAIEDAIDETAEIEPSAFKLLREKGKKKTEKKVELKWQSRRNYAYLPAVLLCVEKWDLENFPKPTRDTFPSIQSNDATILITTLFFEIFEIYKDDKEVPNA